MTGHVALFRAARAELRHRSSRALFLNPAQFSDHADLTATRATRAPTPRWPTIEGVDVALRARRRRDVPAGFATWVDARGAAQGLEAIIGRAISAALRPSA